MSASKEFAVLCPAREKAEMGTKLPVQCSNLSGLGVEYADVCDTGCEHQRQ